MNFLKEAHSAFDFAKYYPLLCKAIADNDSTTPGYIYEEIIKISFLSHQHRIHLVDFLLTRLTNLGWAGKQKVIRILLQLCKKGHFETRNLLRQRDGELRKAASLGGPPDPVLANTPQLFFNSAIQELLSYIFDPNVMKMDEEISQKGGFETESVGSAVGYGSSGNHGKYEGFGNTPISKQDSIVDQVYELVGKVVTPEARRREELEGFLKGDKGNYQPFCLSPHIALPSSISISESIIQQQSSSVPPLYKSVVSPRGRGHVAGKVGGGWDSDEAEDEETLTAKLTINSSSIIATHMDEEKPQNEHFIQSLLQDHPTWPVDYEAFVLKCKESTVYNPFELLNDVSKEMKYFMTEIESKEVTIEKSLEKENIKTSKASHNVLILLLFIEYCLTEDLLSVNLLHTHLLPLLNDISLNKVSHQSVKTKSKKIYLLLKSLSSYT